MLSQSEIDALLSGSIEIDKRGEERVNLADMLDKGNGGGSTSTAQATLPVPGKATKNERQVTPYNFWSPDRFSKDQMRAIELIHEDLAERLTASLPSFLRTNFRPRVVHTEQGRFHDFLQDLPPSSLFHLITLAPLPGNMVLTISPDISATILELRLGGKSERHQGNRGLTEIDQQLLRQMVETMLNDIKAAWNKLAVVEPGLEDSTANSNWVQMIMGNERMMLVTFELNMPAQSVTGTMNIYIPFNLLKPILNLLNPYIWISGQKERRHSPEEEAIARRSLDRVLLPIRVILGDTDIRFSQLIRLKPGDVVQLDQGIEEEVPILVGNRVRFMAHIGRSGHHLAAQVTQVVAGNTEKERVEQMLQL